MLKHIVLFFILVGSLFFSFFGYCMDEHSKHAIERRNVKYLSHAGTEDVPQEVQNHADNLVTLFQRKGLLHKDTKVLLKFFNETMLAKYGIWNRAGNGKDLIYMGPIQNDLTSEEMDSALGHELAHIVLHQNQYLNPHFYMFHLNVGLSIYANTWPITSLATVLTLAKLNGKKFPITSLRQIKYEIAGTTLGLVGSGIMDKCLFDHAQESCHLPVSDAYRVTYPCIGKVEEGICDVIAALSMPHGGRAGKSFYEKILKNHGNKASTGHPLPSTRVKYHSVIAKVQDIFTQKKEGPTIK